MARSLHQVFLQVSNIENSVRFYRDALGLDLSNRTERSATFETGQCELVIESDFDTDTLAEFGLEPPGTGRGDGAIFVIEVMDVEEVYERAKEKDANVLIRPRDVNWGRKLFLVKDPDGYAIELSKPI